MAAGPMCSPTKCSSCVQVYYDGIRFSFLAKKKSADEINTSAASHIPRLSFYSARPQPDTAFREFYSHFNLTNSISFSSISLPEFGKFWDLTLIILKYFFYKLWRPKVFFLFEIIKNVLVNSFCFIWIPILWVCGHNKCFTLSVRGSDVL